MAILLGAAVLPLGSRIARAENRCPDEFEAAIALMLGDLPAYANRIVQRSRFTIETDATTSVILASKPDFEPLPLPPQSSLGTNPIPPAREPRQVFFTTLSQRYDGDRVSRLQKYHWLFFVRIETGWQLVFSFLRIGSYPSSDPPTAPYESSDGIIAQAVREWLSDCRALATRDREDPPSDAEEDED